MAAIIAIGGTQECKKDAVLKASVLHIHFLWVAGARESPQSMDYQEKTQERKAGWIVSHMPHLPKPNHLAIRPKPGYYKLWWQLV